MQSVLTATLITLAAAAAPAFAAQSSLQSVEDNIRPVGQVCLAGQACVGTPVAAVAVASPAAADLSAGTEAAAPVVVATTAPAAGDSPAPAPQAPPQAAEVTEGFDVEATYMRTCFACHSTGVGGAPKVDAESKPDWDARIADKGLDGMVQTVITGLGTMPPKGLCFDCSDADLQAIVEYMVDSAQ